MYDKYYGEAIPAPEKCPFGIFVDQAGYFPKGRKRAVLASPHEDFCVETAQGECRFKGKTSHFGFDALSGDDVYIADFTEFSEKGQFRVAAGDVRSALFEIGENVYDKVFADVQKAFYFLHCGSGLDEKYAGVYAHPPCHTAPALLWEDESVALDVSGGWHDAGDYGRYVTAASCALAHLLYAYKLFPKAFGKSPKNVPESGMPYILAECRHELEWLLKMQRADGAVYHKVTTKEHAPFIMPENDNGQLYVLPASSMATADFTAVCALASGIYSGFDAEFAQKLKKAAEISCGWLEKNPDFLGFKNPDGCSTGEYGERDDFSNRFWANAEMYSLTGDPRFHESLQKSLDRKLWITGFGYAEVGGLGALAYILCDREKEAAIEKSMRSAFFGEARWWLKAAADKCGYGAAMHDTDFHWGSNMTAMRHGMLFAVCDALSGGSEFREYAAAQLHYLLGTNPTGYSYVTGTGEFRCRFPHLRPAHADGIEECMPGMVSGGPNRLPCDPAAKTLIPEGTPPMKCYADCVSCYSLNEITIYWNSPTVFVLAYLLSGNQEDC